MGDADADADGARTSPIDAAGSLSRAIDAFDALGLTSRTFRGLAATAGFSRVAVDAGQSDPTSREGKGGDVGIGIRRALILKGTGKAETFAVLTDIATAIASDFSGATCGAGLTGLLLGTICRIGGGGIGGDLSCSVGSRYFGTHIMHIHGCRRCHSPCCP